MNNETKHARQVIANDGSGYWDVFEGDCWLAQFESESLAYEFAAAPALLEALNGLFEHCAMVHKHWGDGSNQREADAVIAQAKAAIAKAEGR